MIFFGNGPGGNRRLPPPVQVRLNRSLSAPADALSAMFPFSGAAENLTGLRVLDDDGTVVFDGIVDEQIFLLDNSARMKLEARSRAALLLDNEAAAETICAPSLPLIFSRYFAPRGFTRFLGDSRSFSGELTVTKGMSEWQAAELFCKKFLGVAPRAENDVLDASGKDTGEALCFGGENGIPCSALSAGYFYCRMLSELVAAGTDGNGAVLRCAEADALGIQRRRFLSGSGNGDALFRSAWEKSLEITVTCPGRVSARPGERAAVNAAPWDETGFCIWETDYAAGPEGETTKMILRRTGTCGLHSG